MSHSSSLSKALLMWFCASSYYLYVAILRVSPSVMMDDIMGSFSLDATGYAALVAVGPYFYSVLQLPAGVMIDKLLPRKSLLIGLGLCTLGTLLFSSSVNLEMAYLSRILMGVGSAFAFLCVNKINTSWFDVKRQATMFALAITTGMIGAINGGAPLLFSNQAIGWKNTMLILAALGAVFWLFSFIFLKDAPKTSQEEANAKSLKEILKDTLQLIKSIQPWLIGISALGIYLSITVIADLWGTNFLAHSLKTQKEDAALLTSLIYVGLSVGGLVFAWLFDRLNAAKILIFIGSFGILVTCGSLFYIDGLSMLTCQILLFSIGFLSGAEMICFIAAARIVPPHFGATMAGFINAVVMLGGALSQHAVGIFLDYSWQGGLTAEGLRYYGLYEYRAAMVLVMGLLAFSVVAGLLVKMPTKKEN